MSFVSLLVATGLAIILLAQAPLWKTWHWVFLIGSAWILAGLQHLFKYLFRNEVRPDYLEKVVRVVCTVITVIGLSICITVVSARTPQTPYKNRPFEMILAQIEPGADCHIAGVVMSLARLHQEGWYWILQNFVGDRAAGGEAAVLVWITLLFFLGVAYSWAFTRLLVGVDIIANRGEDGHDVRY